MNNLEMNSAVNPFENVDNDELARRINDIDHALQNYSGDSDDANLKRGEARRALYKELERRMGGDTAAAAELIERNQLEDYEQAA